MDRPPRVRLVADEEREAGDATGNGDIDGIRTFRREVACTAAIARYGSEVATDPSQDLQLCMFACEAIDTTLQVWAAGDFLI